MTTIANRVSFHRLKIQYLAPNNHPAPEQLRSRLDCIVRGALKSQLQRETEPLLDASDASIWFIRRFDLDITVNSDAEDAAIARHFAKALAFGLHRCLENGPNAESIVRFGDRTEYVSQFLIDLARQQARQRWYYSEFQDLFVLGDGAAACEALCRVPTHAETVLLRLFELSELEKVLALLSAREASKVYNVIPLSNLGDADSLPSLIAAWPAASIQKSQDGFATPHNALRLFLATRSAGTAPSLELRSAIETLLELADWLAADSNRTTNLLTHARDVPCVQQLILATAGRPGLLADTLSALQPTISHSGGSQTWQSQFAGLFLAWSAFVKSGLVTAIDDSLARFLIAIKIVGRTRRSLAFYDSVPRILSGLQQTPSPGDLRSWTISPDVRKALLRSLVQSLWCKGRIESTGSKDVIGLKVERVLLPSDAGEILLFRDIESDAWVYADYLHEPAGQILDTVISVIDAMEGPLEVILIPDADVLPMLGDVGVSRTRIIDQKEMVPNSLQSALANHKERARPATDDLEYFAFTGYSIEPNSDLALTLIARATMRAFAARFRGFGWSSADYIERNFLASSAIVGLDDGCIDVRLRPPPLHLVLRLAGLDRDSYTLADNVKVNLRMDDDR